MPTRYNRLWLQQNAGFQATFVLCEKCGEWYEASLEHVCRKRNSYPMDSKVTRVMIEAWKEQEAQNGHEEIQG